MNEKTIEKEKEYLYSIYKNRLPDDNPFILHAGDNREMFVMSYGENSSLNDLDMLSQYRVLYATVLDLKDKIFYSLSNAIEYTYTEDVQYKYSIMHSSGNNEWLSFYNIENAMFRIETLWDILAHFYNLKYHLGKDIKNVYHGRIFSKNKKNLENCWENNLPADVNEIIAYINEEDDTSTDGEWKGNYRFINSLRNNMTHNFSISQTSITSYALQMKHHPSYILKRLCENFATLENFVYEVCESILKEVQNKSMDVENQITNYASNK